MTFWPVWVGGCNLMLSFLSALPLMNSETLHLSTRQLKPITAPASWQRKQWMVSRHSHTVTTQCHWPVVVMRSCSFARWPTTSSKGPSHFWRARVNNRLFQKSENRSFSMKSVRPCSCVRLCVCMRVCACMRECLCYLPDSTARPN